MVHDDTFIIPRGSDLRWNNAYWSHRLWSMAPVGPSVMEELPFTLLRNAIVDCFNMSGHKLTGVETLDFRALCGTAHLML